MADKNAPPDTVAAADEVHAEQHQQMFEQHWSTLMSGFGEACEGESVDTAIAIAQHPKHNQPLVYIRGNDLEVAKALAKVLKEIKRMIHEELNTD